MLEAEGRGEGKFDECSLLNQHAVKVRTRTARRGVVERIQRRGCGDMSLHGDKASQQITRAKDGVAFALNARPLHVLSASWVGRNPEDGKNRLWIRRVGAGAVLLQIGQ